MSLSLPREGRLLGIDFGEARIGLAVADVLQSAARPETTVAGPKHGDPLPAVLAVARDRECVGIVIGLPRHMDGKPGDLDAAIRQFGERLAAESGLPIAFWEERWSSVQADRLLQQGRVRGKARKEKQDALAAQIILQSYLDRRG